MPNDDILRVMLQQEGRAMSNRRKGRAVKTRKASSPAKRRVQIEAVPSKLTAKVSAVIALDQQHFAAKPHVDWFVRPYTPGEFEGIDNLDLSTVAYTLVRRMGPNAEQIRIPLTEEMARRWLEITSESGRVEQARWEEE